MLLRWRQKNRATPLGTVSAMGISNAFLMMEDFQARKRLGTSRPQGNLFKSALMPYFYWRPMLRVRIDEAEISPH